jgi:hypothetical protein
MDKSIQYTKPTDKAMINQLVLYVDASHADSDNLRTTIGYVIYLNGGPISWRSMLSKTHCQSPTESEYTGMYHAVCEVISIRNLMEEIGYNCSKPTLVYEDNEAAKSFAKGESDFDKTKHILQMHRFCTEMQDNGLIIVQPIDTKLQRADQGTKILLPTEHAAHTAVNLNLANSVSIKKY